MKITIRFCFIGYDKADVMVTLPVHSTNVVAIQKAAGYNTIGILKLHIRWLKYTKIVNS